VKRYLPYYEISGTYKEIGNFLGSTFKDGIQKSINTRKKEINNYESYLKKSQECLDITKKYFPNLIEESESIAEAADVPFIDFFFANNREVYDTDEEWDRKQAANVDHCTVVAGFDNGNLVIGHNEDWSMEALESMVVLKVTVNGVSFIGLNYNAGVCGLAASMNNLGLVQCINDIYQTNKIGVPKNYIARAVLEAKSLDEAEKIIKSIPRASGFNHVLAQGNEIRNIEIAGDEVGVQKAINEPYVHTNHYLTKRLKSLEKFHTKSSEERYKRASELLRETLTKEDIISILSDTENKDYPICRSNETIGSAVFIPSELKSYFCYGPPNVGEFIEHSL
jgi:hypothetical protein